MPLGTGTLLVASLDALFLAGDFPLGIGLKAGALLVRLREAPFGLRDRLAICERWLAVHGLATGHTSSMPQLGLRAQGAPFRIVGDTSVVRLS